MKSQNLRWIYPYIKNKTEKPFTLKSTLFYVICSIKEI